MTLFTDNDPNVCRWLRGLIDAGLLVGDVLERSITDVRAEDILGRRRVHWFAGIGGWELALRLAGWPDERPVWSASCPCQPFSAAGKGKGVEDERHLWPILSALVRECKPDCVIGEQVSGTAGYEWLDGVRADLESQGYTFCAADIPAAGIGAPHIRQRLFWGAVRLADAPIKRSERRGESPRQNEGRSSAGCGRQRPSINSLACGLADAGDAERGPDCGGDANRGGQRRSTTIRASGGGGTAGGLGDAGLPGREGRRVRGRRRADQRAAGAAGGAAALSLNPWAAFDLIPCRDTTRDGRRIYRRGPAGCLERGIQCVVDGLPAGMGGDWVGGLFPTTTTKIPGCAALLRGFGNAIVVQAAAAFVRAFIEAISEFKI